MYTHGKLIPVHDVVFFSLPVSQFSDRWETAEVDAYTKYKAGTGADIKAKIGLHIGLKGVNITLKGRFN